MRFGSQLLLLLLAAVTGSDCNDTLPVSVPRQGTTRSPFQPTFAPYAATPVPQPPKGSSTATIGSRFLSFLRNIRGTLEDVVSDVDPGVERILYMVHNESSSESGGNSKERLAEVIMRKNSILTRGASRIIGCRIYADPKVISERRNAAAAAAAASNSSTSNSQLQRKYVTPREMANLINNCNDIDKMKPYMIPTLRTEQELLSGDDEASGSGVTMSTSRKSPAPGGEDEKSGVFDGVAIYPGTKWYVLVLCWSPLACIDSLTDAHLDRRCHDAGAVQETSRQTTMTLGRRGKRMPVVVSMTSAQMPFLQERPSTT